MNALLAWLGRMGRWQRGLVIAVFVLFIALSAAWTAADCRISGVSTIGIFANYGRGGWDNKKGWFGVGWWCGRLHFMHFTHKSGDVKCYEFPPYSDDEVCWRLR